MRTSERGRAPRPGDGWLHRATTLSQGGGAPWPGDVARSGAPVTPRWTTTRTGDHPSAPQQEGNPGRNTRAGLQLRRPGTGEGSRPMTITPIFDHAITDAPQGGATTAAQISTC